MKKKPIGLIASFPFTLRNHIIDEAGTLPENWSIVSTTGGKAVRRTPPIKANLKNCIAPNVSERLGMTHLTAPQRQHGSNSHVYREAHEATVELVCRARKGDGKALWLFSLLACEIAEGLSQLAAENPEAFRPIARKKARWPLMQSTHPRNCDKAELLTRIELGADIPVQLDKYSKWKPDYAGEIAISLFEHLQFIRSENITIKDLGKKEAPFSKLLPPFSKDTAPQWWHIAEQFLLRSYPEPQKILEFKRIVSTDTKRTRTPGRLRAAILEKIEKRFLAIAK